MTYPLIASSDVMVAANSTTILESALLGTPPIAVVSRLENIGLAYSYNGVSEIASSKSDIINAIRRNIEGDRNKKRKISMHLRNSDARACERLAHLINRLVE
jgi:predicted glycosyltransferase